MSDAMSDVTSDAMSDVTSDAMSDAMSDAAVVARVLAGDRDAYGVLVTRHQDLLYRHARGMGLDHDTSLDLVQDAFIRAWQRLRECREPAYFKAWVFRVARNLCLDHLKNVRRAVLPFSAVPDPDRIGDVPAAENAVPFEEAEVLRAALHQLPDLMRDAFLLRHDAGYSYDEIAAMTDASVSAVKMRVHRAREALRDFLAGAASDARM